jgi:hypothetical protein
MSKAFKDLYLYHGVTATIRNGLSDEFYDMFPLRRGYKEEKSYTVTYTLNGNSFSVPYFTNDPNGWMLPFEGSLEMSFVSGAKVDSCASFLEWKRTFGGMIKEGEAKELYDAAKYRLVNHKKVFGSLYNEFLIAALYGTDGNWVTKVIEDLKYGINNAK